MQALISSTLRRLRAINQVVRQQPTGDYLSAHPANCSGQKASDLIRSMLLQDQPAMICRFGSVELDCISILRQLKQPRSLPGDIWRYLNGSITQFWWDQSIGTSLLNNAGFFPVDAESLENFYQLMLDSMTQVDILGSWLEAEGNFSRELQHSTRVRLRDLEPYYHPDPWSTVLEGKRVLVIHPFETSIRSQYRHRQQLFGNPAVLPDFELITLKSLQTLGNNRCGFATWFDALEHMCEQTAAIDFDIALIGCGAYGFPLAAFIKKLGKKAVHLGGSTQILFGIKGKRWENHEFISTLFNEHWVKPLAEETPENYQSVEQGCYW